MKRIALVLGLLVFLSMGSSGCALLSKNASNKSPGMLEPSAILKFSDIPVPAGFKFLAQESYSFETSGVRVGVLKYIGRANIEQVISFYKEQMPMFSWSLLNIIEYGERLLNFDREGETCIIRLEAKGGNTVINISLGPKSQQNYKKSKETIK